MATAPKQFIRPSLLVHIRVMAHQQVMRKRMIDEALVDAQRVITAAEIVGDARGRVETASHRHRDAMRCKRVKSNSTIAGS